MAFLRNLIALSVSIALAMAAAGFGAQFATGPWYRALDKPPWNPPDWVFGPVWSFLYLSMAIAAWLIWRRKTHPLALPAFAVYFLQLLLNAAWSWMFFGEHWMGAAFAEILVLDAFIAVTLLLFYGIHRVAGALFIPYLAWVTFAAFLNFTLWRMNV